MVKPQTLRLGDWVQWAKGWMGMFNIWDTLLSILALQFDVLTDDRPEAGEG